MSRRWRRYPGSQRVVSEGLLSIAGLAVRGDRRRSTGGRIGPSGLSHCVGVRDESSQTVSYHEKTMRMDLMPHKSWPCSRRCHFPDFDDFVIQAPANFLQDCQNLQLTDERNLAEVKDYNNISRRYGIALRQTYSAKGVVPLGVLSKTAMI